MYSIFSALIKERKLAHKNNLFGLFTKRRAKRDSWNGISFFYTIFREKCFKEIKGNIYCFFDLLKKERKPWMVIKRLLRFFSLSGSQTMFLIHFPFWFFLKLRMDSTSPFLFGPSDVAVCRLHLESGSSEDSKSSMIMYFRFAERLNFNALETVFFALDNPVTLFSEVSTLCSLLSSL